jgi:hypothetical protein
MSARRWNLNEFGVFIAGSMKELQINYAIEKAKI